jgi:hypothetical protein
MTAAEIAELLEEAAAARLLAAQFENGAAVADLLAYAAALEADAAAELAARNRAG